MNNFQSLSFCWSISFILLISITITSSTSSNYRLTQVHVLGRHGERDLLARAIDTQEDRVQDVQLVEDGVEEMKGVGQSVRDRYMCPGGHTLLPGYNEQAAYKDDGHLYYSFSSDTERTLMSANAFNLGLWTRCDEEMDPYHGVVPVHSRQQENDVLLRSYANCPAFHDKIEDFYNSIHFILHVEMHKELLLEIGGCFSDYLADQLGIYHTYVADLTEAELEEIDFIFAKQVLMESPNLWDAGLQMDKEGSFEENTNGCNATVIINSLEPLAAWIEHKKYTLADTGKYIGTAFLHEISYTMWKRTGEFNQKWDGYFASFDTFSNVDDFKSQYDKLGLLYYASHYPMIKGVLHALGVSDQVPQIPEYGATFFFELHEDHNDLNDPQIMLLYKDGINDEDFTALNLTHMKVNTSGALLEGAIMYEDFINYISETTYQNIEEWCSNCQNTEADVCLSYIEEITEGLLIEEGIISKNGGGRNIYASTSHAKHVSKSAWYAVAVPLSVICGFIGGMIAMALFMKYVSLKKQNEADFSPEDLHEIEFGKAPSSITKDEDEFINPAADNDKFTEGPPRPSPRDVYI